LREFEAELTDREAAALAVEMRAIVTEGLIAARHLRGEIFEVHADGDNRSFRVLFAAEGKRGQVLLALHAFVKKTRKTPSEVIQLAETRLADWRQRGRRMRSRG
jgi:phage-related protein